MKNTGAVLTALSAAFGTTAAFMPALTFLTNTQKESLTGLASTQEFTGFYYMVGQRDEYDNVIQEPVVGLLIAWIIGCLGALAILASLMMFLAGSKGNGKRFALALGGLSLIAYGIMAFLSKSLVGASDGSLATFSSTYELGIGAILAGVFASLSGLCGLIAAITAKK